MSHLNYAHRTYFRSSESDSDSFQPYLIATIIIILSTGFFVGIQFLKNEGKIFLANTSEPLSAICNEVTMENCPKPTIIKQLTLNQTPRTLYK